LRKNSPSREDTFDLEDKIATDFDIRLAGMNIADCLAKGEPQCGQEIISFIQSNIAQPYKEAATDRGWK
jgi:hypothetical protein